MKIKHKLISLTFLVAFLCWANPVSAQNKLVQIFVQKEEGKTRTRNNGQKYPGYSRVQVVEDQTAHMHIIRIICTGKGWDLCPDGPNEVILGNAIFADTYENMVAKVQRDIDQNITDGRFYMDGWYCSWDNGSKTEDVENDTFIYSYNLMIQSEVPAVYEGAVTNQ